MSSTVESTIELQKRVRDEVRNFVGETQLQEYSKKSLTRSLFSIFHPWFALVLCFFVISWAHNIHWALTLAILPLLGPFVATRQNALNVQIHEASHFSLCDSRKFNDLLCNLCCAYWIGYDTASYRNIHLKHHGFLNSQDDPDLPLYSGLKDPKVFRRKVLESLLGITALKRLTHYDESNSGKVEKNKTVRTSNFNPHIIGKLLGSGLIVLAFVSQFGLMIGLLYFVLFWILPLVCFFPILIQCRLITEHYSSRLDTDETIFVSRSTLCGPLEHYLLGAQMDFHFEHHLFAHFPYYQCKRLHLFLREKGYFGKSDLISDQDALSDGYLQSVKKALVGSI